MAVFVYISKKPSSSQISIYKNTVRNRILILTAIQLKLKKKNVIIFCVYRAPSRHSGYFFNKLDCILNSLYTYKTEFIICGNININYLGTNNKKKQLDYLFGAYNLISTVYCPTRTVNNSITLIDNIFIDNKRKYTIKPCINGLSDHDAQLITLNNFSLPISNTEPTYIRNINKNTIAEFQLQLSWSNGTIYLGITMLIICLITFLIHT
jgi:hypothetical protein